MQTWQIVVIALAIVVVAIAAFLLLERQRSARLRRRFGPEYDRKLAETGNRREAELDLVRRERRLEQLHIQPLPAVDRDRFLGEWKATQSVFVDDPARAVDEADRLVNSIMMARGYTSYNATERMENISAAYPHMAASYREACDILADYRTGRTSTENLRRAMVNYREVFDELIGGGHEEYRRVS
jgi:hypothetical protein